MDTLLNQIEESIADERLSDDEKRDLAQALREASPPEEGLRQLRNRAFALVRERLAASPSAEDMAGLLKWLEGVMRSLDVGRAPQGTAVASAHFSPGTACLQAIVDRLRAVRRQADLCVFTLSDDRITAEVLAAHARGFELLLANARLALDYRLAKQAEAQTQAALAGTRAQLKLNTLAALTFPLMTVAAVFGMNLHHGLENQAGWLFWAVFAAGLVLGLVVKSWVRGAPPPAPVKPGGPRGAPGKKGGLRARKAA